MLRTNNSLAALGWAIKGGDRHHKHRSTDISIDTLTGLKSPFFSKYHEELANQQWFYVGQLLDPKAKYVLTWRNLTNKRSQGPAWFQELTELIKTHATALKGGISALPTPVREEIRVGSSVLFAGVSAQTTCPIFGQIESINEEGWANIQTYRQLRKIPPYTYYKHSTGSEKIRVRWQGDPPLQLSTKRVKRHTSDLRIAGLSALNLYTSSTNTARPQTYVFAYDTTRLTSQSQIIASGFLKFDEVIDTVNALAQTPDPYDVPPHRSTDPTCRPLPRNMMKLHSHGKRRLTGR